MFFSVFAAGMWSWFSFGIKESSCFMSGVTLREDKREMVVIRNKVLVTFEASFDIHPLSVSSLSSFPPTSSVSLCLILCFRLILLSVPSLFFNYL